MRCEGRAGICGTNVCNTNIINHSQLLTSVFVALCVGFLYARYSDALQENVSRDKSQDDSLDTELSMKEEQNEAEQI